MYSQCVAKIVYFFTPIDTVLIFCQQRCFTSNALYIDGVNCVRFSRPVCAARHCESHSYAEHYYYYNLIHSDSHNTMYILHIILYNVSKK